MPSPSHHPSPNSPWHQGEGLPAVPACGREPGAEASNPGATHRPWTEGRRGKSEKMPWKQWFPKIGLPRNHPKLDHFSIEAHGHGVSMF